MLFLTIRRNKCAYWSFRLTAKCKRSLKAVKAVTHFTVLERFDAFTLVELQLETGRTHQIRVHMKYIGYPLAEIHYMDRKTLRQWTILHAKLLGFTHPTTGEQLVFEAPLPEVLKNFTPIRIIIDFF